MGYNRVGADRRNYVAFPLLPRIARVLGGHVSHEALAGILFSQLCLLGCVLLFGKLAHGDRWAPLRQQPGFWLLVSPLSFFFSVFYTESLFLLLSLVAVVLYRRQRVAAVCAANVLAGLTRPTALLLPALFVNDLVRGVRRRRDWGGPLLCAVAPLTGLALWIGYVGYTMRDPLAYLHIGAQFFDRRWTLPFEPLVRDMFERAYWLRRGVLPLPNETVRLFSACVVLAVLAWGWRRLEGPMVTYVLASMLFLHSQEPHSATARYELVLFPIFLLLPQTPIGRRHMAPVVATLLAAMQLIFLIDFGAWHWVA
ncbi:MAG: hypothetical protein ACR2OG_05825 [Gemmatimonadaceae bacterium]